MRLLFYRYGSICEPDLIETFQTFGFEIIELTAEIHNKDFSPQEAVTLVGHTLLETPCDFVFSINFYPFLAEICDIMQIRYLCWVVDSPVLELYSPSIRHPWNRVFLFDRTLYEEISPLNQDSIFYLPLAVNPNKRKKLAQSASNQQRERFRSAISFVGSLYSEKCPYRNLIAPPEHLRGYLDGIIAAQLNVYGCYFIDNLLSDNVISEFKAHVPSFPSLPYADSTTDRVYVSQYYIASQITMLERTHMLQMLSQTFDVALYSGSDVSALPHIHARGLAKTETEMPLIFHESRINLNMTAKSIRSGLPLRIWDILGSGGFCLSNFQAEIPEYFVPGEDLDTYSCAEELRDKCNYYLEHDNIRKEIAENGYQKILRSHTYEIRLSQLMELAFSH